MNNRREVERVDINDATYPLLSPYVSSISHSTSGTLFVLNQDNVLMKAYGAWGPQEEENSNTSLTMSRDNLNILVENRAIQRAQLDDPSQTKDTVFHRIVL